MGGGKRMNEYDVLYCCIVNVCIVSRIRCFGLLCCKFEVTKSCIMRINHDLLPDYWRVKATAQYSNSEVGVKG